MAMDPETDELAKTLGGIDIVSPESISTDDKENDDEHCCPRQILILDAGYGFPFEKKVRKEKINAITSQLSNFLIWQAKNMDSPITKFQYSDIRVVGCPNENTKQLLESRTLENMKRASSSSSASIHNNETLPSHVKITCETLEGCLENLAIDRASTRTDMTVGGNIDEPVYLSPDAHESLDPSSKPPKIAIVGLLIDRRVQPNRSRDRAHNFGIVTRRWPLEECFTGIDPREPLNVDCVLEGMQQWWWNWEHITDTNSSTDGEVNRKVRKETFIQAASQAIDHHAKRHPSRPLHIPSNN